MRIRLLILCLLLNASVLLVPISNVHAHIDAVQHEHDHHDQDHHHGLHGGHSHDFDHEHEQPVDQEIRDLELSPVLSHRSDTVSALWWGWGQIVCAPTILLPAPIADSHPLRPPDPGPLHPDQRKRRLPPLRGPPA